MLVLGRELEVEGDQIRERARVLDALDQLVERLGGNATTGAELGGAVAQLPVERLEGGIVLHARPLALHLQEDGAQHVVALLLVADDLRPSLSLHEQLDASAHPVRLDDAHHGADLVEDVGIGLVHVFALRNREQAAVAVERLLHGLDGAGTARRDRDGYARIDDRVPERQDR